MTNKKYEYEKGRDWTFIVYPESAPENWREILDETHLRWIESPLHDKDISRYLFIFLYLALVQFGYHDYHNTLLSPR